MATLSPEQMARPASTGGLVAYVPPMAPAVTPAAPASAEGVDDELEPPPAPLPDGEESEDEEDDAAYEAREQALREAEGERMKCVRAAMTARQHLTRRSAQTHPGLVHCAAAGPL
jgi:hypothetical protein